MGAEQGDNRRQTTQQRQARVHSLFNPPATATSPDMAPWRIRVHDVIFEADTWGGRTFDLALLWAILISTLAVVLESVPAINARWGTALRVVEWAVTVLFTIEYLLRIVSVSRPLGYIRSFFGVVDLLAVIPTYLSLFVAGTQALAVIRVLRVLRIFRLLKIAQFADEAELLFSALAASLRKITVFLGSVLTIVMIMGATMYVIEGPAAGFDSIPRGIYWAVVTLTTVGYGDIAPKSAVGQAVAACIMITGYAIIAVPTGIVTVELAGRARLRQTSEATCAACGTGEHALDAAFCRRCGAALAGARSAATERGEGDATAQAADVDRDPGHET